MPTYPFNVPSGVSLIPIVSGTSSLGTGTSPFNYLYAQQASIGGIVISGSSITGLASIKNVVTITGNTTLTASNDIVLVNTSGASVLVTLPTSVGLGGKIFDIKKINSQANDVVISGTSSQTIDGSLTQTIATQYNSISLVSNSSDGYIL